MRVTEALGFVFSKADAQFCGWIVGQMIEDGGGGMVIGDDGETNSEGRVGGESEK